MKRIVSWHTLLLLLPLLALLAPHVSAEMVTFACSAGTATPLLRAEGFTEMTGDVVLNCAGTVPGGTINTDITLSLSAPLTSRILNSADGSSEVLLLIDEPSSANQVPGTNVFQGKITNNQVTFSGVSFLAPGTMGVRYLRITNLRTDATAVPPEAFGTSATVSATGMAIGNATQILGFVLPGLNASVRKPDDSASGAVSLSKVEARGTGDVAFNLKFTEGFATAFKMGDFAGAQNVPGLIYNTESMFFNPFFPTANGLDRAGLADQGTRLTARFSNIPAGVSLYVTVSPSPVGTSRLIDAHLTARDVNGAGPYLALSPTSTVNIGGTSVGIAPVILTNGSGMATWEIFGGDPTVIDSVSFGVVVSYVANVPPAGTGSVTLGLAPMYENSTGPSLAIPRFRSGSATTLAAFVLNDGAPACAAAPTRRLWFHSANYTSNPITNGDRLLVGVMSNDTYQNGINGLPLPTGPNQIFCSYIPIAPGLQAIAYVPTAAERGGDFHEFSGVFLDPATSNPFPGGILPANRIPATFAWRLYSAPIACPVTVTLSGNPFLAPPSASTRSIDVAASNSSCGWGASSNVDWLTLSSGGGIGNDMVTYSMAENTTGRARTGIITIGDQTLNVTQSGPLRASKIAAYGSGYWVQDLNGNFAWDGLTVDRQAFFSAGQNGEVPVSGDWNGDGTEKLGVYANGTWILDYNGNGLWDGAEVDKLVYFGGTGWTPVVGDWDGSGKAKIGAYRDGTWMLDYDGSYTWNLPTDKLFYFGGAGYTPLVGDWSGTLYTKVGVYKDGLWLLDYDGNFAWNPAGDKVAFFGGPSYTPVVGDWNASGATKIGAMKDGLWVIDLNGNFQWDGPGTDKLAFFGGSGWIPMAGDWDGSGAAKVGAYKDGAWVLDYNRSYEWEIPPDKLTFFGGPGQIPVAGKW